MVVFVVPDIHGRTLWREPVKEFLARCQPEDRVVFLGDYNDAWDVSDQQMLDNFIDVILCKERNPEQVILLLGNHCFPYLTNGFLRCSGFRQSLLPALSLLYKANKHLFQLAYQVENVLFVHAGLTTFWLEHNQERIEQWSGKQINEFDDLAHLLNYLLTQDWGRSMLYQVGRDHGGWDSCNGPVWVRPGELGKFLPPGIIQVVGHTGVSEITKAIDAESGTGVILTDTMGRKDHQYLQLTI